MNSPAAGATGSEARLVRVLDDYLAALQRGDAPDRAALRAEHPELANDLEACLGSLDFIRRAAAGESGGVAGARPGPGSGPLDGGAPADRLGDFRIIREAGRGGMGVVFEAEQVSLGRRVALKVLPFAAALDPRQLARFRVEAQAAALLHHTNIVPIFSVGSEQGVHYYAMQFIDGRSLAEVILELRQLRRPDTRVEDRAASVGSHAGPSDGPVCGPTDAAPKPLTASWPSGSSATGRPFFEAAAKLGIQAAEALEYAHSQGVVHRDVKPANLLVDARGALWVTDFGLARLHADAGLTMTGDLLGTLRYMSPEQALARRTAIDHRTDVYSLGVTLYELLTLGPALTGRDRQELLRQIAFEEPPSPRRHNPAVPRELETVVLKAMAKEPADRYATAQELADDLGRFLEHRPIRARRPNLAERTAKWGRRHPASVGAAFAILATVALALLTSTLLVAREQRRTAAALRLAETRSRQARMAIDRLYTRVARERLENQPKMQGLQLEVLREALACYQELAAEEGASPIVRRETASAYFRVAEIAQLLGEKTEALDAYRRCLAFREALVAEFPGRDELHDEMAAVLVLLARLAHDEGKKDEFRVLTRRAFDLRFDLAARFPGNLTYRDSLAHDVARYGPLLEDDDLGRYQRLLRRAFGPGLEPPPGTPMTPGYRRALARAKFNLAQLLSNSGRLDEAAALYRQSHAIYIGLVEEGIATLEDRRKVAVCLDRFGEYFSLTGRGAELREAYPSALSAWDGLIAAYPEVPSLKHDRAWSASTFSWALSVRPGTGGDPTWAVTLSRQAVALAPRDYGYRRALGAALYRDGEFRESKSELIEAVRLKSNGLDPGSGFFLAMVHARLGDALTARSWFDRATREAGRTPWAEWEERVLRDEAAALLGVPGQAKVPDKEKTTSKPN